MFAARYRGLSLLCLAAAASACGSNGSEPAGGGSTTPTPASISATSGNGQTGTVGFGLPLPLIVTVTASSGAPVPGVTVTFAVTSGAATVAPGSAVTDSSGHAQTTVTLGSATGSVQVTATVSGTSLTAIFTESAGASTASLACQSTSPVTMTVGQVNPGVGGSGICLAGGSAGAEYAVVAFYGNPDSSSVTTIGVTSHGATAVITPNVLPAGGRPMLGAARAGFGRLHQRAVNTAQAVHDLRMRGVEHRMAPRMAAARASLFGAHAMVIPKSVTVGQIITLNANGQDDDADQCTIPINKPARVVAISNTAIVVADTTNPKVSGFTDAEYTSFATMFDTLINPLDTTNFGQPTDIDGNGHILIFFTDEVNKLTPAGSEGEIGGFFDPRDLFPTTSNSDLEGCATSNFGEMFYMLVPDSLGQDGNAVDKSFVQSTTPSTLAHEYQHLINAARRIYVNDADQFEDVWLNEGLSHTAEELLFYRASGFTPLENLCVATNPPAAGCTATNAINATQQTVDAFNDDQSDNFGRYEVFLGEPTHGSPFAENDSLQTRGATWNLLRYLVDHGTPGGAAATYHALVNTGLAGQANLSAVFGGTYMTQIRDWATSVFTDDVAGVSDARFEEPSWNMRNIFPNLSNSDGQALNSFPLSVIPLSDATPATVSIIAGGTGYLRFFVSAGSNGSIDWTSVGGGPASPFMQFTVVRTR